MVYNYSSDDIIPKLLRELNEGFLMDHEENRLHKRGNDIEE